MRDVFTSCLEKIAQSSDEVDASVEEEAALVLGGFAPG